MNIFNKNNIIFGFVVLLTIVFTGAAGVQFVKSLVPTQTTQTSQTGEQNAETAAPSNNSNTDATNINGNTQTNDTASPTSQKTDTQVNTKDTTTTTEPIVPTTPTFSAAELKTHNTSSSCYVAYNAKVYDVTNDRSWRSCYHHGVRGGIDMTSIFPHPLYYLDTVPMIGNYSG